MTDRPSTTIQLAVSPAVARLVKQATRAEQLAALRDGGAMVPKELLTLSLVLLPQGDAELKTAIVGALQRLNDAALLELLGDPTLHVKHLELLARVCLERPLVIAALLDHPQLTPTIVQRLALHGNAAVFTLLAERQGLRSLCPELLASLRANQRVPDDLKKRFPHLVEPPPLSAKTEDEELDAESEEDPVNLSKYQLALEMPVAEKIKMAMTGDKEWRNIFIKDANKLVSAAVLKNPRITDGEVLTVAKNKSSSEELIRLITLNNEWTKVYDIKRALVLHHRTPLPKALRYMSILSEKDLKSLAKSRDVSSAITNNARRMLLVKEQKK